MSEHGAKQRLQGGEDVRVAPMDTGADLLRNRLRQPGVAAPDFRAGLIDYSPAKIGESGEVVLTHRLGRVPRGIMLLNQSLQLGWSVPSTQKAKWDDRTVAIWLDARHFWEHGKATLLSGQPTVTVTMERFRLDSAGVGITTATGIDHATATDHPPIKRKAKTTSGTDTSGFIFALASEANAAFDIGILWIASTQIDPSDTFVWLVI